MAFGDIKNKIKEIQDAFIDFQKAYERLDILMRGGPPSFYFEKMSEYTDGLFSFSKLKLGDVVALASDASQDGRPGWNGFFHFMKRGARATVCDVGFGKNGFGYSVEFDNETWLDDKKVERPVSAKHVFWFGEAELEFVSRQLMAAE